MSNEVPNARRLVPPDQPKKKQSAQSSSFGLKVAAVALPIVIIGVGAAVYVRSQLTPAASSEAALNDTRSPFEGEVSQTEESQITITQPSEMSEEMEALAGTDAPYELEAYPEIDPDQKPLAVAVNPSVAGIPDGNEPVTAPTASSPSESKASYGHLPYNEGDRSRLVSAGTFVRENYEREEQLDFEAAQAFEQMRQAAQAEGIDLMLISGFRSIADQKDLFDAQIERKGSPEAAAVSSAPAGHSEHHTGLAVDITDANNPNVDLRPSFEGTPAYQWLAQNASLFGFEESFPKNNQQGVTFEPWHWRYVGTDRALQTFSEARQRFPSR